MIGPRASLGPDGRFASATSRRARTTSLYIEEIVAGGYPTNPQTLVSEGEYWNIAESSDPATDRPCNATPITAQAGVTPSADMTFNGYAEGVQYMPVVNGYLIDLARTAAVPRACRN